MLHCTVVDTVSHNVCFTAIVRQKTENTNLDLFIEMDVETLFEFCNFFRVIVVSLDI